MGLNGGNMGLGFTLSLRDMMSGALQKIERAYENLDKTVSQGTAHMSDSLKRVTQTAGVLAATLAPLGASFAVATKAGDFVQGLAAVEAATGATAAQMRRLHDIAIEASATSQFAPAEAVGGLISLATAGQTAAEAMQTLRPSLDLAAASLGELSVPHASEAIVGTLNSYAFGAEKAREVTDKLVHTTMVTNFQMRDFSVGLARAAEAGSLYGQSLDDVLVGMGLLRNRNIAAEVASTALRNAMVRVNSDVRSQNMIMRAGVPLRDKYTGQLRSILDVISEFASATQHLDPLALNTMVKDIFGEEGMPAFSAVMNATFTTIENGRSITHRGAQAIAAMRQELGRAGGAAERFVTRYNDNLQGQMQQLGGSLRGLAVLAGESFAALLKKPVEKATQAVRSLLDLVAAVPMPIREAAAAFALAGSSALALGGAVFVAVRTLRVLKMAALVSGRALLAPLAGLAAASWPVVAGVAAVSAATGLLAAAYQANLGGMAEQTRSLWETMNLYWKGLGQVMNTGALSGDVLAGLNAGRSEGVKRAVTRSYQLLQALSALWEGIRTGFAEVGAALAPYFRALGDAWQALKAEVVGQFADMGLDDLTTAFDGIKQFGKAVGGVFAVAAAAVAIVATRVTQLATLVAKVLRLTTKAASFLGSGLVHTFFAPKPSITVTRVPKDTPTRDQHSTLPSSPFSSGQAQALTPTAPTIPLVTPLAWTVPAASEIKARSQADRPEFSPSLKRHSAEQPISVAVQIDGETVARAVARAQNQLRLRSFEPLRAF